ncbi:MAG: SurA N-terminal domain-containing protein [Rhodocyclaceae bacterium]
MFEAVRKNKRISQVILAIIIVPFAFFGMDAYFTDAPGRSEVATVGGHAVTVFEFDQALRDQQQRLTNLSEGQLDMAFFQTEAFRRSVLESLINQRLLALHALDNRLVITQQQLQEAIAAVPMFQEEGRFSLARYEQVLRSQGTSPAGFEAGVAHDLRMQQIAAAVQGSAFVSETTARQFLRAQLEERIVRELRFPFAEFESEVSVSDDEVSAFYAANQSLYQRAPRMKADYLIFDELALVGREAVSEETARQYYEANAERFGQTEERRARHILVRLDANANEAAVTEAMAKANEILDAVREDPSRFETLARERSEDPGSARNGGDLGFFGRGAMVGAFEEAAFALEKGAISDVVRSDFGLHVIQLVDVKPAALRPFDEVRDEILFELGRQEAGRQFAAKAEHFTNMVYEQHDSLEPAAAEFGLEIRTSDWISRDGGSNVGPFANERLLSALFADEAVRDGHNVEAIEIERGTLVSARVREYEAARLQPLDEVREDIVKRLRDRAAERLAQERGEAVLARLQAGEEVELTWSEARFMRRGEPSRIDDAMRAIFSASSEVLPAYVGSLQPGLGFSVFKVESVKRPEIEADDVRLEGIAREYERLVAEVEMKAFVDTLRSRYKVEIREAALRRNLER